MQCIKCGKNAAVSMTQPCVECDVTPAVSDVTVTLQKGSNVTIPKISAKRDVTVVKRDVTKKGNVTGHCRTCTCETDAVSGAERQKKWRAKNAEGNGGSEQAGGV